MYPNRDQKHQRVALVPQLQLQPFKCNSVDLNERLG
jgi:hypothetical protein